MSCRTLCIAVCVASLLSLLVAGPVQATTLPSWEVGAGWSDTVADPSPWAYGQLAPSNTLVPVTSTFALFTAHTYAYNGYADLSSWTDPTTIPDVDHYAGTTAFTTAYGALYNPNDTTFYPHGKKYAVVRWTAPATGLYDIAAVFTKNQTTAYASNALIYQGGSELFSGWTTATWGSSASYSGTDISLTEGENLYFMGGRGPGNNYTDTCVTRLGLTITQVPEPGTLALLATGLFGLLCYAWRKRR